MIPKNDDARTMKEGDHSYYPRKFLSLDPENPRLAEYGITKHASQSEIVRILWEYFDVAEVAHSIAFGGFYPHEPLLVEFDKHQGLVLEGNRRLAAVLILCSDQLRKELGIESLPQISNTDIAKLDYLPVVKTTRENAWRYLGFKHINGPATWGAYAKAKYVAEVHRRFGVPLDRIAEQIGDFHSTVKRMYRGLLLVEQAEGEKLFSRDNVTKSRFYFNYLYTGASQPGVRKFLGLNDSNDMKAQPVPPGKLPNLKQLLLWLYGDRKGDVEPLIRRQNPDLNLLDEVLLSKEGTESLRNVGSLELAREATLGPARLLRRSMQQAQVLLGKCVSIASTGSDAVDEQALQTAGELHSMTTNLVELAAKAFAHRGPRKRE